VKRFFAEIKFNHAVYGADIDGVNFGKDIFKSLYVSFVLIPCPM
jgi:hypothetical protein